MLRMFLKMMKKKLDKEKRRNTQGPFRKRVHGWKECREGLKKEKNECGGGEFEVVRKKMLRSKGGGRTGEPGKGGGRAQGRMEVCKGGKSLKK